MFWRVLGKVGYAVSCLAAVAVLVISYSSYTVVRAVHGIGGSHAISSGPSIGAQNILLMGLESRRDWNGNILPRDILAALHAGSYQGVANGVGGEATNTLILIHIPAGGKGIVGFSIPRDDWVTFANTLGTQQQGKIDQAYGVSMAAKQSEVYQQNPKISQNKLAFEGNEAGRAAAVATVEKLTGVRIDHFAEVNLDGFYEIAKVLGGVEVCLNHATKDSYSGANFHAGLQHLNAAQALAFVRQRHGLTNGDLDRTHRQQAFLDAVMYELRKEGVMSDLGKISSLLSSAKQYMITDSGWNLLQFAESMGGINVKDLSFRTLPIQQYGVVAGQDVNIIDPAYIKRIVQSTFYPPHKTTSAASTSGASKQPQTAVASTTVSVLNGGQTAGLGSRVSAALVQAGYLAGKIGNTPSRSTTEVLYGSGESTNATAIAKKFGAAASSSASVAAGHIEVLLGSGTTTAPDFTTTTQTAPVSIPTTGAQGNVVKSTSGIPCVD